MTSTVDEFLRCDGYFPAADVAAAMAVRTYGRTQQLTDREIYRLRADPDLPVTPADLGWALFCELPGFWFWPTLREAGVDVILGPVPRVMS